MRVAAENSFCPAASRLPTPNAGRCERGAQAPGACRCVCVHVCEGEGTSLSGGRDPLTQPPSSEV